MKKINQLILKTKVGYLNMDARILTFHYSLFYMIFSISPDKVHLYFGLIWFKSINY